MPKKNVKFSNYTPLSRVAEVARHKGNVRHAERFGISRRDWPDTLRPRHSPYDGNVKPNTSSKRILSGIGQYSRCMAGQGRYYRPTDAPRRGEGRGLKRVLGKRGGREMLSRQFWDAHPEAAKPWWATENPRLMAMDEIAAIHQHSPALAVAALERVALQGQVRPLDGGEVSEATRRRLMDDPNFRNL